MKKLLTLVVLFLSFQASWATHIIGGELYYDCLGNNTYKITLKVYRDCFGGETGFDNPVHITIWPGDGSLNPLTFITIPFTGSISVPFVSDNPCFQPPANVCVEQAIYITTVTLQNSPSGYIFAYQRCCRNTTIQNVTTSGNNIGATYFEQVPVSDLCNNSPRFNNYPPIALCLGEKLCFDHSATDPDGDELVYSLCSPYVGASLTNPKPIVTSPPPFLPIIFNGGYTPSNPINSAPPITIDPVTGLLCVTPTTLGQYVVGVCVSEYRNGVLIGTHNRDFQFNVTNCESNVQAIIGLPPEFTVNGNVFESCDGLTIPFENNSINGTYWHWDFGDGSTSDVFEPTHTYPASGTYTVTLVVNQGFLCESIDQVTIHIRENLDVDFATPTGQCIDLNSFDFLANGNIPIGTIFSWDFTPTAVPATSNTQNTFDVNFTVDGSHTITLIANFDGCEDIVVHDILVYGHPTVTIDATTVGCVNFDAHFIANVDYAFNNLIFKWNFGDLGTSTEEDPIHIYYNPGNYSVSFQLISLTGCMDIININKPNWINVYPVPRAGFTVDTLVQSIFWPHFYITDQSSNGAIGCWMYYGNGDFSNNCNGWYVYSDTGHYNLTQIVYNKYNCPDTMIIPIIVKPEFVFYIPNTFTPDLDGLNDGFKGKGEGIKEYNFRIWDRWGRCIFNTTNLLEEWNGSLYNIGALLPEDVYVYSVDIIDVLDKQHKYRGKVLLKKSILNK